MGGTERSTFMAGSSQNTGSSENAVESESVTAQSPNASSSGPESTGSETDSGSRRSRRRGRRRHRSSSSSSGSSSSKSRRASPLRKLSDWLALTALLAAGLSVVLSIPMQEALPGLVLGLLAFVSGTIIMGVQLIRGRRAHLARWALGLSMLSIAAGLFAIRRERLKEEQRLEERNLARQEEERAAAERVGLAGKGPGLGDPAAVTPGGTQTGPASSAVASAGQPTTGEKTTPATTAAPASDDEDVLLSRFGIPVVQKSDDSAAVILLRQRGVALKEEMVPTENPAEERSVVTEVVFLSPRASDDLLRTLGPALSKLSNLRVLNLFGGQVSEGGLAAVLSADVLSEVIIPQASDGISGQLTRFRNLRSIIFDRRGDLSDAGIQQLAQLTKLRRLELGTTPNGSAQITDSSARALSQMPLLRELIIPQTAMTVEGIRMLGNIQSLERLDLSLTEANDESLSSFAGLQKLRSLRLRGTSVQGPGLQHLAKCMNLETLHLSELSPFDCEELKHLVGHPRLKELILSGTKLDARAIKYLKSYSNLELLEMNESGVGEADLRALKLALPNCAIEAVNLFSN